MVFNLKFENNQWSQSLYLKSMQGNTANIPEPQQKKIIDKSSCTICLAEEETAAHVLWTCSAAQDIWSQASPKIQKLSYHSKAVMDVWRNLVCKLDHMELSEAAFVFKLLWLRRNEFLHCKSFIHP